MLNLTRQFCGAHVRPALETITIMNQKKLLSTVLTLISLGSAVSALGQNTIMEQSRIGGSSQSNNPDFVFSTNGGGFASGTTSDHSSAPGLVSGWSTASRYSASSSPGGPGTNVTISPNGVTSGTGNGTISNTTTIVSSSALTIGQTYLVSCSYAGSPTASSPDITVNCSDTGMSGIDTFNGIVNSTCFQGGNGYNKWIPIGYITPGVANPSLNFAYSGGVSGRWNVDSFMFSPVALTPPTGTDQYWNPGTNGAGGSGSWTASTTFWNTLADGTGTQGTYMQANLADFTNGSGTVTIDPVNGITTDGGLEFDVNGYILTGGTLTLGSSPSTSGTNIAVVNGSVTINAPISAPYGLCSAFLGTINLGAAVTFPGAVGTVTITYGKLHLNPGTSQSFPSLAGTISGALAIGANTLTVGSDNTSTTFAGVLSDGGSATPGAFIKTGTGTLTNSGANTYYGPTTINQGVLTIAADSGLGTAPASLVSNQLTLNGGRLDFTAAASLAAKRGITIGAGGGTLSTPGSSVAPSFNGPISGSGSLTIPSGTIDLKGNNSSFSGNIYVTATPVDSGGNNLCNVRFDAANSSGTGKIFISPTTLVNCTLRNFNTAGTVIVPMALEFDPYASYAQIYLSGGASGTNVFTLTFSGNINGAAPVIIGLDSAGGSSNPGGTVNLSGSNTLWTGGATLQAGTLGVGSSNALGTGGLFLVPQGPAGVLLATTPLTGTNALTNSIGINTSVSSLTIGGANNLELAGPVFLYASSTLNITNTASTIFSGSISDNGSNYSLTISSTTGSALTLSGSNNYTGGTIINSGTLIGQVANSIPGDVTVNGGTLELDVTNAMSPSAVLNVNTSPALNLTFAGAQTVGALFVNGSQQAPGTYGVGTNNPNSIITGTGLLNVVTPSIIITSASLDVTGTIFTVCWQSIPGLPYDVLTNTSLSANGSWSSAGSTTASDTNTCLTLPGSIVGNSNVFVVIKSP